MKDTSLDAWYFTIDSETNMVKQVTKPPPPPKPTPKEFPGWRAIGDDEPIKNGDVWFSIGQNSHPEDIEQDNEDNEYETSAVGETINELTIKHGVATMNLWVIYRRTGRRKLPMNAHYSQPLPLP